MMIACRNAESINVENIDCTTELGQREERITGQIQGITRVPLTPSSTNLTRLDFITILIWSSDHGSLFTWVCLTMSPQACSTTTTDGPRLAQKSESSRSLPTTRKRFDPTLLQPGRIPHAFHGPITMPSDVHQSFPNIKRLITEAEITPSGGYRRAGNDVTGVAVQDLVVFHQGREKASEVNKAEEEHAEDLANR